MQVSCTEGAFDLSATVKDRELSFRFFDLDANVVGWPEVQLFLPDNEQEVVPLVVDDIRGDEAHIGRSFQETDRGCLGA